MISGRMRGELIESGFKIDDLLVVLAIEFATLVTGDLIDRIPDE